MDGRRSVRWWPGARWAAAIAACLAVLALGVFLAAMASGNLREPYTGVAREIAWALGLEDESYNFGVVVPGRVYRSGRPDLRFLRALRERFGVRRVLSLNDANDFHDAARADGFEVIVFDWSTNRIPPREELDQVLDLMDEGPPILVHCSAGKDRSGYAIAEYRITRQGWSLPRAFEEMDAHWHDTGDKPWFQAALRGKYGRYGEPGAGGADRAVSASGRPAAPSGG